MANDDTPEWLFRLAEEFLDVREGETFATTNRSLAAIIAHLEMIYRFNHRRLEREHFLFLAERVREFRIDLVRRAKTEKALLPDGETIPFATSEMVEKAIARVCPPPPEKPH